ncbi:MAG TPA: exonuclease domain-containing protein [Casimicrobiaceae bacterium]|nr:exonuclease domain-containing protein [Casimicrobiaceae bacterium]
MIAAPLFAPAVAFVDLETTGTHAAADRITEVGIVRVSVDGDGDGLTIDEWSSLVDPGVPIPPAIQALTGITDAMVRAAPTFASVAREIEARLADTVFVAHNARFDYGFLKHEFLRLARPFKSRVLCTVRLSRRLFPEAEGGHGLDAVIARHGLECAARHRALGDAKALWQFVQALYATLPVMAIEAAVKRLLKIPSLPAQLPPDVLDGIPEGPGVYLFYGDNPLPLYIGKSRNLRERVAAHFTSDWATETDLRLSAEIRRIECEPTAGELGALLREATLIKALLPAHNRALRRKSDAGVMTLRDDGTPAFVPAAAYEPGGASPAFGPFASRRSMREALSALARDHALCWSRLGIERRIGPCFSRQLKRCGGVCDGGESVAEHDQRFHAALAPLAMPRWPFEGPALIREASVDGERVDVHVVRDWAWLGTARDDGELQGLLEAPPHPAFDVDVTKLLLRTWMRRRSEFMQLPKVPREKRDFSPT